MSAPENVLKLGDGVEVIGGEYKGCEGVVALASDYWPTVKLDRSGIEVQVRRDYLEFTEGVGGAA